MKKSRPIIEALGDLLEKFESFKGVTSRKSYWCGIVSIILVELMFALVFAVFALLFFGLDFVGDSIAAAIGSSAFWYEYIVSWIIKAIFTWLPATLVGVSGALVIGFPITMILPTLSMTIRRTRDAVGTCLAYVGLAAVGCAAAIICPMVSSSGIIIAAVVSSVCALASIAILVLPSKQ